VLIYLLYLMKLIPKRYLLSNLLYTLRLYVDWIFNNRARSTRNLMIKLHAFIYCINSSRGPLVDTTVRCVRIDNSIKILCVYFYFLQTKIDIEINIFGVHQDIPRRIYRPQRFLWTPFVLHGRLRVAWRECRS